MRRSLLLLTLAVLTALTALNAQSRELTKDHVQNLIAGINSENTGLQRSSIYFAGYYKVDQVADEVRSVMLKSTNPDLQILAALALYEMGDVTVMEDLQKLTADSSENMKVRRMAKAIYDHWNDELKSGLAIVSH